MHLDRLSLVSLETRDLNLASKVDSNFRSQHSSLAREEKKVLRYPSFQSLQVDNQWPGSLVVLLEEEKRTTARTKDFNTGEYLDSAPTGKCYCWGIEVLVVQECSLWWILMYFG